jgi:hypothetical protein
MAHESPNPFAPSGAVLSGVALGEVAGPLSASPAHGLMALCTGLALPVGMLSWGTAHVPTAIRLGGSMNGELHSRGLLVLGVNTQKPNRAAVHSWLYAHAGLAVVQAGTA